MNQGRMYMVGQLMALYPDLAVQTYYQEEVPDSGTPPGDCPPIFTTWAEQKMDIIFGTSNGYQFCMAYLAAQYPDTLWFDLLGDMNLTLPNWGIGVGNIHQAMFLAGMVAGRETKTGKVGACMPLRIPQTYAHLAAFAYGVAYANASVEVVTAWTDEWQSAERHVFMVQRMVVDGVDIVFHRCQTLEGVTEARTLGIRSIGFNTDFLQLVGESVLISPYYNWGPLFLQVARLVVEGTYAAAVPVDLFPGLESDAVGLTDASYLVHPATMAQVSAVEAAFRSGANNTFCGPLQTNTGTVVGQVGSCLTLHDLRVLTWEPWNVVDRGHFALPDELCHPGEQSHWDGANEKYYCTACPAGTYSRFIGNVTYQAFVCLPCPANMYSPSNATNCFACPGGYAVTANQDGCSTIPMATAVLVGLVVGSVVGAVVIAAAGYGGWRAWKASADLRRLRKQFSNNNVAQECAEAIACFNLESVAWLRTCSNPNKIQQAFLQILEMLTAVRPYIPDHILSIFTQRRQKADLPEVLLPGVPEKSCDPAGGAPSALRQASSDASGLMLRSDSEDSSAIRTPRGRRQRGSVFHADPRLLPPTGDWVRKRCTYLSVAVSFASPGGAEDGPDDHNAEEDEAAALRLLGQVLGEVIAIGKGLTATIDVVTWDRVMMHWGLVSPVAEGALKATQAALEMGKVRSHLPSLWQTRLRLDVSVVQGVCNVATISAAGHSFFVVAGPLLRQLSQLHASGLAQKCQCETLISENVYGQVQYAVECMPRGFVDKALFWQPVSQRAAAEVQPSEWMYEVRQMEAGQPDKWGSHSLFEVLHAASQTDDSAALQSAVARLREQFQAQMSVQDEACLTLLLSENGQPRT
eukprot:EG_transcript_990